LGIDFGAYVNGLRFLFVPAGLCVTISNTAWSDWMVMPAGKSEHRGHDLA
jgi:hypothetical protein